MRVGVFASYQRNAVMCHRRYLVAIHQYRGTLETVLALICTAHGGLHPFGCQQQQQQHPESYRMRTRTERIQ